MFNKPSLTNRNDPLLRREVRPGQPSPPTAPASSTAPANPATPPAPDLTTPAAAKAASPEAAPDAANDGTLDARLIVGPNVKLKGAEILDCDTLVVEGRVEATMDSRVIRIAEHGAFAGKVSIDIAEIHGHFEGELTARSQLIIHATGRVSGKIRYGKLVIDEGGELSGEIRSLSEPATAAPTAASIAKERDNAAFMPVLTAAVGA